MTSRTRLEVIRGDITRLDMDAIINAANETLLGGGGVDGAIHHAAGPELLEACRKLGGCRPGEAKVTPGFRLPAKWVIHTVGPRWRGGVHGEAAVLASCFERSLGLASEIGALSVAFPAISCGVFGYPVEEAAAVSMRAMGGFVRAGSSPLERIIVVAFNGDVERAFRSHAP